MRSSAYLFAIATIACTHGDGLAYDGLQNIAAAVCDHARSCSCNESDPDPDDRACETIVLEQWEFYLPPSGSPERVAPVLDVECHERAIEILRTAECHADLSDYFYELPCAIWRGTGNVGDPCEDASTVYNPCVHGLACIDGKCEEQHVVGTIDSGPGPGESCAETGECNSTAWCDMLPMEGPVCRALIDVGENCTGHRQCLTTYCPAGKCEERPLENEACGINEICADGLACMMDRCVPYYSCVPLLD